MNASYSTGSTALAASPGSRARSPRSLLERLRTGVKAALILRADPNRLDQVLVMFEALNYDAIVRTRARVKSVESGRSLLVEQPRIDQGSVDWERLQALPDGTLGREYVRFMTAHNITPEAFEVGADVGDRELSYLILRVRQTHDLWHVVTGFGADVPGEILLQAFMFGHMGSPPSFLIAVVGSVRYARALDGHWGRLVSAYRRGRKARNLVAFRWESHWETPVAEVKHLLACGA